MATDYFALAVAQARQQFTPEPSDDRYERRRAVPSRDSIYQTAIRLYWASREAEERSERAEGGRS